MEFNSVQVKWWSTFNEPRYISLLYDDNFVPGIGLAGIGQYWASRVILLSHARVYHLYNTKYRQIQGGKFIIILIALYFLRNYLS